MWRAVGAIAAATMRGEKATVVCVSYGERGESASQWLQGKSLDEIKTIRRDEASAAAETALTAITQQGASASVCAFLCDVARKLQRLRGCAAQ